jgi:hypothetical protein
MNKTVEFSVKNPRMSNTGNPREKCSVFSTTCISGGEGGIVSVVAEREVRVGERWYASCFQRRFPIRGNRLCLCGF